ncbi:hypothetical protein [Prevotella sp. tc2-28]|nr:hypothetical protein [Prevotella sp. tc2-28]
MHSGTDPIVHVSEAKGANTKMVMLGQKLNMEKWQLFIDYYGAWEDISY